MEYDNFLYIFTSKRRNGTQFLKCKFWKSQFCQGTGKLTAAGEFTAIRPHNHEPVRDRIGEFRNILTQRAASEHGRSLRVIYDEEVARFPETATEYPFLKAEGTMRASRKRSFPDVPETLPELAALLQHELKGRYNCHGGILDVLVDEKKESHMVVCCHNLLESVADAGVFEMHCDGTFKVIPERPHARQLFTIHGIVRNTSVVLMYALMSSRSKEAYRTVLTHFQDLVPSVSPAVIITGFETELQEALVEKWPAAEVKGSLFHYAQAVWKRMRKMGYLQQIRSDPNAQNILKMLMSLPLVPENRMEEGLQHIKHFMEISGVDFPRLTTYVSRYWLDTVGAFRLSVYGVPKCTNNNLESFHNILKTKFRVLHPNIWLFISEISKFIRDDHVLVGQLVGVNETRRVPRDPKAKYTQCLEKAKADLESELITIGEYLSRVSHVNDLLEERLGNWYENVGGEPESSNDEFDVTEDKCLVIKEEEDTGEYDQNQWMNGNGNTAVEEVEENRETNQDQKIIQPIGNTEIG